MDDIRFEELYRRVEALLRRAPVAWYGPTVGRDAAAEALVWAWTNRGRLAQIDNVPGYLFRVGQSVAKRDLKTQSRRVLDGVDPDGEVPFEPDLLPALEALTERQRASVVLVHGYRYSYREAADVLGVSVATLRTHLERAMTQL